MLQFKEADLPVLLLVLVVLPLVTYVLLGIWSDTSKKKARISMLAQLATKEAFLVQEVAQESTQETAQEFTPVNVIPFVPSSKTTSYECAKCSAPATTRCSKCKSVRYCSGKCQIMHWRSNHKLECHLLAFNRSLSSRVDNSKQVYANVAKEPLNVDFVTDVSNDAFITSDRPYNSTSERKNSDFAKQVPRKLKNETSRSNSAIECSINDTVISGADSPLENKPGSESFTSFKVNKCQDSTSSNYEHAPTKSMTKPRSSLEYSKIGVNECETARISNEQLYLNSSAEDSSTRGSVVYSRPPYILGSTTPLSQKSVRKKKAYMDEEFRVSATYGISSNGELNISGSQKFSNVHKWNLTELINDSSKSKMLFPYEDLVKYFQCELWGISPRGLLNCGNSCYANAVLQCLTCTKPLMVYLLRRSHSNTCRVQGWCLMCELEQHVLMLREGGGPLSPSRFLSNMRNIGCRIGGGDQEDAHEFLRFIVMSMQSICLEGLGGEKEVNPRLQETTLIQQIFGGRLKSKVMCLECHLESEKYENIMDLTLEIHGWVESLEDALTQFTAPEDLDGENMYRCGRCAAYVKARKQLSVHEVPNILTIVLKRFRTGKYGKINKCVTFPDMLDMIPFVTGTADSPPLYMLYGVVVHLDTLNASFSGHYVSYVKDLQGTWFRIDDSEVHAVLSSEVMSEGAYMLFYSRSFPRPPRAFTAKASKASLRPPTRNEKTSKHRHALKISGNCGNILPLKATLCKDFSDATSSDWSLFTSSDDSSFTTESTRNSFSTVDHNNDSNDLDPISSIFAPPFYAQDYSQSNTISCTKILPCGPQTRFFSEKRGFVLDSTNVHLGCRSKCNF